jgi:hypothetical protein
MRRWLGVAVRGVGALAGMQVSLALSPLYPAPLPRGGCSPERVGERAAAT